MNYIEYGKGNPSVIILLHAGGLSWWNYREIAERLASEYHVVLPILDGHAQCSTNFTTIEANAAEIIHFIDELFGGTVLLIGGVSLGGQILLEILSQRKNICQYAMIESALVIPSKITHSLIKPAFGSCYGLIHHRWFAKLQFQSLRMKPELFEDYFRDTRGISKQNMISFLQANALYTIQASLSECTAKTYIFAGERENRAMQKSAKLIHQKLRGSTLQILPKLYHGEFSINHAEDYVKTVREILKHDNDK